MAYINVNTFAPPHPPPPPAPLIRLANYEAATYRDTLAVVIHNEVAASIELTMYLSLDYVYIS